MSDLILSNFGSYFSVFAVLNLGYATSKSFRNAVDESILQISDLENSVSQEVDLLRAKSLVLSETIKPKLIGRLDNYSNEFKVNTNKLIDEKKRAAGFVYSFKSMFLLTSFYSLIFLVLAGYQRAEECNSNYVIYNILHFLNAFLLLFNLFIFFRSFTKYFNVNPKPFIVSAPFFIIVLLSLLYSNYSNNSLIFSKVMKLEKCVSLGVFIAISPYVFHFVRAYIHRRAFKPKEQKFISDYREKLKSLNSYIDQVSEDLK